MAQAAEQTLMRAHPSRLYSFGMYVVAFLLFAASAILLVNRFLGFFALPAVTLGPLSLQTWLIGAAAFFGIVFVIAAEIRRIATTYTVTDARILRREGIFNITLTGVPFRQVERLELKQSLLQRIFRVGTVAVDTGEELVLIENVKRPDGFERTISQRMATFR